MNKLVALIITCSAACSLFLVYNPVVHIRQKGNAVFYKLLQNSITLTPIKNVHQEKVSDDYFCTSGNWIKKEITKTEDLIEQRKIAEYREKKNWPKQLINDDLRCGVKNPIGDVKSQCNSSGPYPCCNEDIGKCGASEYFCGCSNCADYSKEIYPELYEWNSPNSFCKRSMLNYKESCAFLRERFTSITFIGDSIIRHLFEALLIHLTNDRLTGALKVNADEKTKQACAYEHQFTEGVHCRRILARTWEDVKKNMRYCYFEKTPVKIQFLEYFSMDYVQKILNAVKTLLLEKRPLIVLTLGLHMNLQHKPIIDYILKPLVDLVKASPISKPIIVFQNIMAHGHLKPISYLGTQGTNSIKTFNKHIKIFCEKNGIIVFDTYKLTENVYSFDGTHYGLFLNMQKIKHLINGLMKHPTVVSTKV